MPRLRRIPSYRLHKPTKQAVVTLDGRDVYLGRHGSPESQAEYSRLVAEWLSNGRRLSGSQQDRGSDLTINEMILAYLRYARGYYVKNGKPTSEPANLALAFRPLRHLYGHSPARQFGPVALKAVRQELIASGIKEDVPDLPAFFDLDDVAAHRLEAQDVLVEVAGLIQIQC